MRPARFSRKVMVLSVLCGTFYCSRVLEKNHCEKERKYENVLVKICEDYTKNWYVIRSQASIACFDRNVTFEVTEYQIQL